MYPTSTDAVVLTGFSFNGSFTPSALGALDSKIASQNQPLRFGSTNAMAAVNAVSDAASQHNITLQEVYSLLSSFNLSTAEVGDLVQTTALWDVIAGSETMPYPIPQDLPNSYATWADETANQFDFFYPTGFDPMILAFAEANKQPFTFGEILTLGGAPAVSPFTGPVHIVTGQQDVFYCGGDCLNTGLPTLSSIPAAAAPYFSSSSDFSVNIVPNTGHAINLHYSAISAYNEIQTFLTGAGFMPA